MEFKASTTAEVTAALASARANPGADKLVITSADVAPITLNQADSDLTIIAGTGGATFNGGGKQETAITVNGADNITIQGFKFTSTAPGNDNETVNASIVVAAGSTGLKILGNDFLAVGAGINSESSGSLINGNSFADVGSYAIRLDSSDNNTVSNNSLTNILRTLSEGAAIELRNTSGNLISHNALDTVGYNGIGTWYPDTGNAPGTGGNIIEFNVIKNSVLTSGDGGAVYAFAQPASQDTIRYNWIEGTGTNQGYGVYLDDYSQAQVYGNVVKSTQSGGVYVHGGKNVSVHDNIIQGKDMGMRVDQIDDDGQTLTGLNVYSNLIISPTNLLGAYYTSATFSSNVYAGPNNMGFDPTTFTQWQSSGHDAGSVRVADTSGELATDWSLKATSQSLAKGVDQPPISQMGVTPDEEPSPLDTLVLHLSQNKYGAEDAKFNVFVDGSKINASPVAVSAVHGTGENTFTFTGDWDASVHTVGIQFINDAWGGNMANDRSLWIEQNGIEFNGKTFGPNEDYLQGGNGTINYAVADNEVSVDKITLHLSQNAAGDLATRFALKVDGVRQNLGESYVLSEHNVAEDTYTFTGHWGVGSHVVDVSFLNDLWAPPQNRNLWVEQNGVTYNGVNYGPSADVYLDNTGSHVSFTVNDQTA